jgi:hypothetical protein
VDRDVVGEHRRLEAEHPARHGGVDKASHELAADALSLPLVADDDGELRRR